MPAARVSEEQVMRQLTEIFRTVGFEGASLKKMAQATGLQPASLYHRFPDGKEQMADAVLSQVDEWFGEHIFGPLRGTAEPRQRLETMTRRLSEFYDKGCKSCLLDVLSLGPVQSRLRQHVRGSMTAWANALAGTLKDAGFAPTEAKKRARGALVEIQGALVVARGLAEPSVFEQALGELPDKLLKKD